MVIQKKKNNCINYEEDNEEEYYEDEDIYVSEYTNYRTPNPDNTIEVTVVRDLYKTSIKENKETGESFEDYKLIKKNVRSKKIIYKDDIRAVEEELNTKGTVYRNKTTLIVAGFSEPLMVVGNYNKLKDQIFDKPNKIEPVGFKFY